MKTISVLFAILAYNALIVAVTFMVTRSVYLRKSVEALSRFYLECVHKVHDESPTIPSNDRYEAEMMAMAIRPLSRMFKLEKEVEIEIRRKEAE